jgi:hypothetical protein
VDFRDRHAHAPAKKLPGKSFNRLKDKAAE